MPYTPSENRPVNSTPFSHVCLKNKGDLTAAIFDLQLRYLNEHAVSYQNISDVIASANDSNDEIKRRIQSVYEDGCIAKNGDFMLVDKYLKRIKEKFEGNPNA